MPGTTDAFDAAAEIILEGVLQRAFPAASVEVGRLSGPIWRRAFGSLRYDPYAPDTTDDTVFDLASLTKVIATTTLVMRAVDTEALTLDDRVHAWLPAWRGTDREDVTIRDLLAHASGLPAYLPFFRDHTGRVEFEPAICALPLEYPPRSQSVYSDLGFMLLGFIIEEARRAPAGEEARGRPAREAGLLDPAATLAGQFRRIASFVTPDPLTFRPPRTWRERTAPTEIDAWRGRLLTGEVHDENTWALGGAAGHAGLFGSAPAVGAFARAVLQTIAGESILARPETFREFIRRTSIPGSSRALGWDTMLPTSSCGTLLSRTAIGHTGFTGTSLWIDWERDLYIVLLTNRVHPTRDNERLRALRPKFHDAVVQSLIPNP
jgi:CubicO group peptidase (beta-lactamase class C family)